MKAFRKRAKSKGCLVVVELQEKAKNGKWKSVKVDHTIRLSFHEDATKKAEEFNSRAREFTQE